MSRKRPRRPIPAAKPTTPPPVQAPAAFDWSSRGVRAVLLAIALAAVAGVRSLPMWLATAPERAPWAYEAANGKTYPYLIGMDSYSWVRRAGNYLATGSPCDVETADGCRDLLRHAPVGSAMLYADSLHVPAIAWLHRLLASFDPGRPVDASAFWVQVVVGTLGVIPAWLIGQRLGGPWAAFVAALLVGLHPAFLERSLGADNDVWNVVLPLCAAAAVLAALEDTRRWGSVAWAGVGACIVALHAAIWRGWTFGFAVLVAGIVTSGLWSAIRARTTGGQAGLASATRTPVLVAACFVGCTLVLTGAVTHEREGVAKGMAVSPTASRGPHAHATEFPDALRDVGELRVIEFPQIRERLGTLVAFGAFLGLVALVLPSGRGPSGRGSAFDVAVLAGVALALGVGVLADAPPAWFALTIVAAMASALWKQVRTADRRQPDGMAAVLVVAIWLAAALYMTLDAQRWLLLAVAPLGLAYAGGATRLVALVRRRVQAPAAGWAAAAMLAVPVGLCAQGGFGYARSALPDLNDAWWDGLRQIRASAPQNAIVDATWPYGYWIEYIAGRGASADGSSVLKRIPHWMGQALLTTDRSQALGLLRMLDCGSDAWPEPEGRLGAYERLRAAGADSLLAHDLVLALARLDRSAADQLLAGHGYPEATRQEILDATHCTPPPAYLMLSETQARQAAVRRQGTWDPRRAAIAYRLRDLPEADAVSTAVTDLGLPEAEARAMYLTARRLRSDEQRDEFVAPTLGYFTTWIRCSREGGTTLVCGTNVHGPDGRVLDRFTYSTAEGSQARGLLRFRERSGATERPPDALVVADAGGVRDLGGAAASGADGWGVLVDVAGARAMFGPPYLIRSMLTRLVWLDGWPLLGFEKIGERRAAGERVITWRIVWPQAR